MLKLVQIIFLFVNSLFLEDPSFTTVIILDDCAKWSGRRTGKDPSFFGYFKLKSDRNSVVFNYGWMDKPDSLTTMKGTYAEILKSGAIFSSDLSDEEWYELDDDPDRRIFILRPEDYCSDKRFLYNYNFTLYEVRIYVSRKE